MRSLRLEADTLSCPPLQSGALPTCGWCRTTGTCLAPTAAADACPASERPLRLLWVEDDPSLGRSLSRGFLRYAGVVDARLIQRSVDAFALALSFQPDLVALDLEMPAPDGLELCRRLKSCEATWGARVLLVTGSLAPDLDERARLAGAEGVLRKPVRIPEVLRAFGGASEFTAQPGGRSRSPTW